MRGINRLFFDVIFNVLFPILAALIILIFFIGDLESEKKKETVYAGQINIEIFWPDSDIDVDLWVRGPVAVKPVGFLNKGGIQFALMRDDLGIEWELPSKFQRNQEITSSTSLIPGKYAVNLHLYDLGENGEEAPVDVHMVITIRDSRNNVKIIFDSYETLEYLGQEISVVSFKVNYDETITILKEEPGQCMYCHGRLPIYR